MTHDDDRLRCDYCGRFISDADFRSRRARRYMSEPDSQFGPETYSTFHVACWARARRAKVLQVKGTTR